MFTGIVEELGVVETVDRRGDAVRLTVHGPRVVADAGRGDSIAVDGCCLTVSERTQQTFAADVMAETLARTSLGAVDAGTRVNLERPVSAGQRLGGHMVQGHVDATGTLLDRTVSQSWEVVEISVPGHLARYLVPQGSVTVDGVSLTVVGVHDTPQPRFTVSLVPETLARTTLGHKGSGDPVNLEVDVIAKYVERLLAPTVPGGRRP